MQLGNIKSSKASKTGMLWGGSVWVTDREFAKLLIENGCYGNSMGSRLSLDVTSSDSSKKSLEELGSSSEHSPNKEGHFLDMPSYPTVRSEDASAYEELASNRGSPPTEDGPPRKKQRLQHTKSSTALLLDSVLLNIGSCHHLLLEEAFYLAQRSCLIVHTADGLLMSIEDLWRKMIECDVNLSIKYLAYECFRSKGWVPKCGMKFGVDYLLYKGGPMYFHSSFGVIVRDMALEKMEQEVGGADTASKVGGSEMEAAEMKGTETGTVKMGGVEIEKCKGGAGSLQADDVSFCSEQSFHGKGTLSWKDVLSASRVNEGAKKDLIICYVRRKWECPLISGNECLLSIGSDCHNIKCLVTKRWLIDKDRLL